MPGCGEQYPTARTYPKEGRTMARGTNTFGDLIRTTLDGRELDALWGEFQAALAVLNSRRSAFAALLTFPTTFAGESVPQTTARDDFEESSEFGEPVGLRISPDVARLGYPFTWFDAATRFTWKFLAEATAAEVETVHNLALEADNRLVFRLILNALSNPLARSNEDGTPVLGLWAGDGQVPPPYLGTAFDGAHSHYLTSGSAVLDGMDVEVLVEHLRHHGYGNDGSRILLLVNRAEARAIRRMRANTVVGSEVTSFDFIPSAGAPAYLTDLVIQGAVPPAEFERLPVLGSIGPALVIEDALVPAGYVIAAATGGPNSTVNPLGFREHKRPELRGLRQIPGSGTYPLTSSFYSRGAGVGTRHRGAAALMQVTANATYTAPVVA